MKRVLILHGYGAGIDECFYSWLKLELEKLGCIVKLPVLVTTDYPNIADQVEYLINNHYSDAVDIVIGHSLGCVVGMKLAERLDHNMDSLILVAGFVDNYFYSGDDDIERLADCCDWNFDYNKIKSKFKSIHVLKPRIDTSVTNQQTKTLLDKFGVKINLFDAYKDHACGQKEPSILDFIKKIIY